MTRKSRSCLENLGHKWHRKTDIVIKEMENEITKIKLKHILYKYINEIKQIQSLGKKSGNSTNSHPRSLYKCHALSQNQLTKKLHWFLGDIFVWYTATEQIVLLQKTQYSYVKRLTVKQELIATIQICSEDLRCVSSVNEAKF